MFVWVLGFATTLPNLRVFGVLLLIQKEKYRQRSNAEIAERDLAIAAIFKS
jgi:hypothetical protein